MCHAEVIGQYALLHMNRIEKPEDSAYKIGQNSWNN